MKTNKDSFMTDTNQVKPFPVTLDFSLCIRYGITVTELFVLYCLAIKDHQLLNIGLWNTEEYRSIINKLMDKGYSDGKNCLIKELLPQKDLFEELWNAYPKETPNGRKLKEKKDATRKLYRKLVDKNPSLHSSVLELLQKEIQHRNKTGQAEYFHNIYSWVKDKAWEVYEEEVVEKAQTQIFGKDII